MNYLSVENISKSFGERLLFENLSFGISKDQKIALVAKNGTGKTTLLNIIAGVDTPDTGSVVSRNGLRIAYLAQKESLNESSTIEESILASDNETLKIIAKYEHALENPGDETAYQKAFELMEQHQAWDFRNAVQADSVQIEFNRDQYTCKCLVRWTEKALVSCHSPAEQTRPAHS